MARADITNCKAPCCKESFEGFGPALKGQEHKYFKDAIEMKYTDHKSVWYLPAKNGYCIKLHADKTCIIYKQRPQTCRKYSCQVNHACFEV